MSCGSPMPRGEQIAKKTIHGIRPYHRNQLGNWHGHRPGLRESWPQGRGDDAHSSSSARARAHRHPREAAQDRKSTRLNSSHLVISYAVFCLKKKKKIITNISYVLMINDTQYTYTLV